MKVKEEREKAGLKLNILGIWPHHFMANRWENNGNSDRLYFLRLQNHCDGDYIHEIKRHLLLGRKVMTNLGSILKSRDITLLTKVDLFKAMMFPGVMYECEIWTIKKAEYQRIDAFELCIGEDSWELLGLQGDPTSPSWRKSVLSIHWKDGCWSWNYNILATWCEVLTHWKRPWCWERLEAGGEEDDRGWDGYMASPTPWTWDWVSSGSWWWTGQPGVLQSMGSHSQIQLSDWIQLITAWLAKSSEPQAPH